MKLLALVLFPLALFAQSGSAQSVAKSAPVPLTDAQALSVREAQLALLQAIVNKTEAERIYQKAIEEAQAALQARVLALQKESHCEGCPLSKDLKWEKPH